MKKLLILSAAFTFLSLGVFAQSVPDSAMGKKHRMEKHDGDKHSDGEKKDAVMMRDGKLILRKDGKKSPLTQDMTLPNGTKVMKNGQVKMKDGSTKTLAEGESLYMDGTIKMKKKKDGKNGKKDDTKKTD